jgi:nicotinate-nucleotide pyrophosphorylase (carboxylating)
MLRKSMDTNEPVELPDLKRLGAIIAQALEEDIGQGDITSQLLIPADAMAELQFVARETMVACGGFIPQMVYSALGPDIVTEVLANEGNRLEKGDVIASAKGPARLLLTGERVTLNLMQRMCGIATLTSSYVAAAKGKSVILDTRKTMPGLRVVDKYSVRVGGGQNHRMRLDDMVLIKDNHIELSGGVAKAVQQARTGTTLPIVVECDTLVQVAEAIKAKPDRILLDNMDIATLKEAVAMAGGAIALEASGGVSLEGVEAIADTGVGYISIGKLTHSAPAADIGADIRFD